MERLLRENFSEESFPSQENKNSTLYIDVILLLKIEQVYTPRLKVKQI